MLSTAYYFTFQYGSTLMDSPRMFLDVSVSFTFQYGSTLIDSSCDNRNRDSPLYIPIWFYFNDTGAAKCGPGSYLYIPIWFYFNTGGTVGAVSLALALYIPIWFYFNTGEEYGFTKFAHLYIPIWFYFNLFTVICRKYSFIFQYGSTLIRTYN